MPKDRVGQGADQQIGRAPTADLLATKLRVDEARLAGERVLLRADFNVPVQQGQVTDDTRIVATLPTLRLLHDMGSAVVVMAHRGRPAGRPDPELTMTPVAARLQELLGLEIAIATDSLGERVQEQINGLRPGNLLLLENLRFHPGETSNDPALAAALAALAPCFVNDAFGASHREHASIVGVPSQTRVAAAGLLLISEVERLSRVLRQPASPFVLVLGGAKVSDKVGLIANLLALTDRIVIGGAMAYAFLAARGDEVGRSKLQTEAVETAATVLETARERGVEILLPEDHVVVPDFESSRRARVIDRIPADEMAVDIGPSTRSRFGEALFDARTVVWNGPMGVFEVDAYAAGTLSVAAAVADLGDEAFTVLGGGDTAAAAALAGIGDRVSHISTGGGASLDLLAGAKLPGVAALCDREV